MSYTSYWVICEAGKLELCQQSAAALGWTSEFTIPLSATGLEPATHYGGHGQIKPTGDEVGNLPWLQAFSEQHGLGVQFVPSALSSPQEALQTVDLAIIPSEESPPNA